MGPGRTSRAWYFHNPSCSIEGSILWHLTERQLVTVADPEGVQGGSSNPLSDEIISFSCG